MGHQNIIYGYIETEHTELQFNLNALARFEYDTAWPLPAMFHLPDNPPHQPVISFAVIYYGLGDDVEDWLRRFEQPLSSLHGISALVNWSREGFEDPLYAGYALDSGLDPGPRYKAVGKNKWVRHLIINYEPLNGPPRSAETSENILL